MDEGIDDTFVSSLRGEVSFAWIDEDLQSIQKYEQYHRPIARPILFWLNGTSFMSPGGLCHPSEDFGWKFSVLEIAVGYGSICCDA